MKGVKVFDSELTDRGTERERVYLKYGNDSLAKKVAIAEFKEERRRIKSQNENEIKPFKHKNDIDYRLEFERVFYYRYEYKNR